MMDSNIKDLIRKGRFRCQSLLLKLEEPCNLLF
jgi:hypothetical protein